MKVLSALGILGAVLSQPALGATRYEGEWYVGDTTDNITGDRSVDAMLMHLKPNDPDFVTVRMRCVEHNPILVVEWEVQIFPDQTVLTIAPTASPDADPIEKSYIFQRSDIAGEPGLRATPEVSQAVVSAIGSSKYAAITSHPSSGSRTIGFQVGGTQLAWRRVSRYCGLQTKSAK